MTSRHDYPDLYSTPHWRNRNWQYQTAVTHTDSQAFRLRQERRLIEQRTKHYKESDRDYF